jgi:hypothetical protein
MCHKWARAGRESSHYGSLMVGADTWVLALWLRMAGGQAGAPAVALPGCHGCEARLLAGQLGLRRRE